MFGIVLGVLAIILGAKGFTAAGIPLSRTKNLTGQTGKVIGGMTILVGILFILDGIFGMARMLRL